METIIEAALQNPNLPQIELEFFEGKHRARRLYEKLDFRIVGLHPDAISLKAGTLLHKYLMVLFLLSTRPGGLQNNRWRCPQFL